ncbi:MAG: hypothetical protein EZS28_023123 [Streblomastix strix]|uniref:Right handed beta helix domain-containing protein n=1 Tax=Streblomastix strix TaxID=222440 RepID=A0A5J4VFF8_9EUKA|nr:MAG: hypothetical protein EZS28_023123 [Streblomastix strix]
MIATAILLIISAYVIQLHAVDLFLGDAYADINEWYDEYGLCSEDTFGDPEYCYCCYNWRHRYCTAAEPCETLGAYYIANALNSDADLTLHIAGTYTQGYDFQYGRQLSTYPSTNYNRVFTDGTLNLNEQFYNTQGNTYFQSMTINPGGTNGRYLFSNTGGYMSLSSLSITNTNRRLVTSTISLYVNNIGYSGKTFSQNRYISATGSANISSITISGSSSINAEQLIYTTNSATISGITLSNSIVNTAGYQFIYALGNSPIISNINVAGSSVIGTQFIYATGSTPQISSISVSSSTVSGTQFIQATQSPNINDVTIAGSSTISGAYFMNTGTPTINNVYISGTSKVTGEHFIYTSGYAYVNNVQISGSSNITGNYFIQASNGPQIRSVHVSDNTRVQGSNFISVSGNANIYDTQVTGTNTITGNRFIYTSGGRPNITNMLVSGNCIVQGENFIYFDGSNGLITTSSFNNIDKTTGTVGNLIYIQNTGNPTDVEYSSFNDIRINSRAVYSDIGTGSLHIRGGSYNSISRFTYPASTAAWNGSVIDAKLTATSGDVLITGALPTYTTSFKSCSVGVAETAQHKAITHGGAIYLQVESGAHDKFWLGSAVYTNDASIDNVARFGQSLFIDGDDLMLCVPENTSEKI